MVQKFFISGFKVFNNQTITLKNLTIFAGVNSVGKSTVIQALLLSRLTYEERAKFGDVKKIQIALNGPFLLQLGNTNEVIRRGKRISDSLIEFSLVEESQIQFKIKLFGDRGDQNKYYLVTDYDSFTGGKKGILSEKIYYLCSERIGPRLKYEYEIMDYLHCGYKGEYTFQVLSGENFLINDIKLFKKETPALLFDQTRKWLEYIIPGASFDNAVSLGRSKVIEGTLNESLPTNVGFGISYVLPIIVDGLLAEPNTILIVENPEAHLHPLGQSRVGRFLAQIASANVQVIIETHSEHVIDGIRISMLEKDNLHNSNSIINFMYKDEEKRTLIKEINFDDEAEFNHYPKGFIDQEQKDTAEMIRLIKQKRNK